MMKFALQKNSPQCTAGRPLARVVNTRLSNLRPLPKSPSSNNQSWHNDCSLHNPELLVLNSLAENARARSLGSGNHASTSKTRLGESKKGKNSATRIQDVHHILPTGVMNGAQWEAPTFAVCTRQDWKVCWKSWRFSVKMLSTTKDVLLLLRISCTTSAPWRLAPESKKKSGGSNPGSRSSKLAVEDSTVVAAIWRSPACWVDCQNSSSLLSEAWDSELHVLKAKADPSSEVEGWQGRENSEKGSRRGGGWRKCSRGERVEVGDIAMKMLLVGLLWS